LIVWILPGWSASHPKEILQEYAASPEALLTQAAGQIRETYLANKESSSLRNGNELVISFQDTRTRDYQLRLSRKSQYSPTFPEEYGFVPRSSYNIQLVTEKCSIHGVPERIAVMYDLDSGQLEFLNNSVLNEIVKRALTLSKDLKQKAFLNLFYESGMTLSEVASLKLKDLDLRHGRIGSLT